MPSSPPPEVVRTALARVLASPGFARNERLSHFLRFVVERHLEGRDGELKESVVGIEVFGRKPGFDPKLDSTVRSEAARLRARLLEYYAADGKADPLRIALPKGAYVPQFEALDAPSVPEWVAIPAPGRAAARGSVGGARSVGVGVWGGGGVVLLVV